MTSHARLPAADTVATVIRMLTGRTVEPEVADGLIAAAGDRQELLAHLVIDWGVLEGGAVGQALQRQVEAVRFARITDGAAAAGPDVAVPFLSVPANAEAIIKAYLEPPTSVSVLTVLAEMA
jgi:hypothetical protein